MVETPSDRFWRQVSVTPACWTYTGALRNGYGAFWVDGRTIGAHTWAYRELVGPIPDGMTIDHTCHVLPCPCDSSCPHRACVNPAHMELTTRGENARRGAHLTSLSV